jgi:hypothetical protein
MICDLFLRSYSGDIAWMPYALRSLHRFVTGIRDIIVVVPANDYALFKHLNFTREILASSRFEERDGYMDQMLDKLLAFLYTDADTILFWDSDVIAIRPFSPTDLLIDGKPRWLITPYAKLVNADGTPAVPWRPITEKAIGCEVEYEAMRSHPLMATSEALIAFRQFMENTHKMSLGEYIAKQPTREFSEWNALGAWAFYYRPDLFAFWHTDVSVPEPFVRQFWSWGGLTPEIRSEMEKLLA